MKSLLLILLISTLGAATISMAPATESSENTAQTERGKAKLIARGKRLYNANNCKTCHSIGNRGGNYGPAMDKLGKHAHQLRLSEEIHGGADEPEMDFKTRHLTREDQRAIIEYLLSIQKKQSATPENSHK
jgi:mono/diheme cytochrome c family protein